MAEIIKTDGTRHPVQPANGTDFKLEEMQAIVGGDIELVFLNDTEIMVVNDGRKGAWCLNTTQRLHAFSKRIIRAWSDYIVGDVLVCKEEQIK